MFLVSERFFVEIAIRLALASEDGASMIVVVKDEPGGLSASLYKESDYSLTEDELKSAMASLMPTRQPAPEPVGNPWPPNKHRVPRNISPKGKANSPTRRYHH
jgi:hypothetical protein